jgi:hypothetical protein
MKKALMKEAIVSWLLGGASVALAIWQYASMITGYTD